MFTENIHAIKLFRTAIGFMIIVFYRWLTIMFSYQYGPMSILLNYSIVAKNVTVSTPRHNHNWNCTKRHLHKWISNSTRTQLWKQNTLRGYLRDIKLKIAEQQDNDDVTMDENDENNNKNNDKNNNETNDENHDENMDDDSNNDEDNSDDAILQAMDVAQVCLYTL